MNPRWWQTAGSFLAGASLAGCAGNGVVPASLQAQLDRTVTFPQLKEIPDTYRGHLVVVGGEVLSARRLKDATRIEVLQIPLDSSLQPGRDRTASQGRFLAVQKDFLDPATVPAGTRVTIVGEVTGSATLPLDDTDYTYPMLEIKALKVWPPPETSYQYVPSYGYRWPYYGPYYFSNHYLYRHHSGWLRQ